MLCAKNYFKRLFFHRIIEKKLKGWALFGASLTDWTDLLRRYKCLFWLRRLQKTYSKPADMIPSQSFGSGAASASGSGSGGCGGTENGRRPSVGQQGSGGGSGRQAAAVERSAVRVSHIDVAMLNSSPTASCKFRCEIRTVYCEVQLIFRKKKFKK